jgi:hypothetical protein
VELKPVQHTENDTCEQAGGPLVRLKLRVDVDGEIQEHRRLGHPPIVLNRIERIGIFEDQWTVPDTSAAVSATLHRHHWSYRR